MVTIKNNQYTMENSRRKSEPMEFVLVITRAVKATNMPVLNQIVLIYTGIDLKFRRKCFQELENNNKNW